MAKQLKAARLGRVCLLSLSHRRWSGEIQSDELRNEGADIDPDSHFHLEYSRTRNLILAMSWR